LSRTGGNPHESEFGNPATWRFDSPEIDGNAEAANTRASTTTKDDIWPVIFFN
jgi:hypothetical protein